MPPRSSGLRDYWRATRDVLLLRYLDGGGGGCAYPGEAPSHARRVFHHLTYYGFLLCLASTTVAALYDNYLGWKAPYPFSSAPVVSASLNSFASAGVTSWIMTPR